MVSGEIDSTKPNSTALPASRRIVQWSWPCGARTSNGNQMGRLAPSQGLPTMHLPLVMQHGFQSCVQVDLPHTNGGVPADVEDFADLGIGPAFCGFQQDPSAGVGARIGFPHMDEGLQ
jgi:hypothetical protein